MTRSKFPYHLKAKQPYSSYMSVCGNFHGVHLPRRSIQRVECKNCLKIIAANVETKFFIPLAAKQIAPDPHPERK